MNEMQTPMAEFLRASIAKIKEMVDANTVVGDPVTTPDGVTLVPVSRVSVGFAGGGGDVVKQRDGCAGGGGGTITIQGGEVTATGGSGAGIRIEPIGFLVCKDGSVRMLNIQPPAVTTLDRVIDLVPQLLDRAEAFIDKRSAPAATEEAPAPAQE